MPAETALPRLPRCPLTLTALVLACGALLLPDSAAWAAPARQGKAASSRTHRVVKPKVPSASSDERPADRDRRLLRECRGRPNAGACLGYTR